MAAIAAITNHYIANTAIHFGTELVPAEAFAAQWQARGRHPWLVAERAGEVLAYAKAGTWRERAAYRHTTETGIYVADGARGGGIGRALYAALIPEIERAGFHTIVAGIAMPNEPSVKLHEQLGFRHVGTFREVGWKLERWHDVAWFERVLPTAS